MFGPLSKRSRVDATIVTLLSVELLDELLSSALDASWPLVRDELGLGYAEIGALFAIPRVVSAILEPLTALLVDTRVRRTAALCGGVALAGGFFGMAANTGFAPFVVAMTVAFVASGSFVGVAQAALVERDLDAAEARMAQWALVGSLGMLSGPLAVAGLVTAGLGWRTALATGGIATLVTVAGVWRVPISAPASHEASTLAQSARQALALAANGRVLRWLVLLQLSDLMLDALHAVLALYFVDVVGVSERSAAVAVFVWTGVGLVGDALLLIVLRRVDAFRYLRASSTAALALYVAFILAEGVGVKLALLGALGIANAGWYSILQAQLYREAPGRAGAVLALSSAASGASAATPLVLGAIASAAGLGPAMWLLALGAIGLLVGLPGRAPARALKQSARLPILEGEPARLGSSIQPETRNDPRSLP
jgi:FSR family fosmidomycin resistance protein-like MFS transporter